MAAIIFDFDGVIIDSQRHWDDLSVEHLGKILPGWTREKDGALKGHSARDNYAYLVREHGLAITLEEFLSHVEEIALDIYRHHANITPGLPALLDRMETHFPMPSIASASRRAWIEIALERIDLGRRFAHLTTSDDVTKSKPDPEIYLRAAEKAGVAPAACIVIEDTDPGVTAAKRAGMFCIGFHPADHDPQALAMADLHIASFDALTMEALRHLAQLQA